MSVSEVVPGVHKVTDRVNSFIIDGDQGLVLIDTGMPNRHGSIESAIGSIGRTIEDVVAILVTHSHYDHVGGAGALLEASKASLFASPGDAPAIQGEESAPPPPMLSKVPRFLTNLMPSADPVPVAGLVSEGDSSLLPDDIEIVETPGHTVGHVSYRLNRSGGVMFVGDAAVKEKDGTVGRGFFNRFGHSSIEESISKLGRLDFKVATFGHSGSIRSSASSAFASYQG